MSDIELVIKIPEKTYNYVQHMGSIPMLDTQQVANAILDGTPLPKGHERLIDELDLDLFAPSLGTDEYVNDLMAKHNIDYVNGDDEDKVRTFATDLIHSCMNVIKTAPTIIEADREA